MERPALRRLLEDIERGNVDCVVVYKVDRLSRSYSISPGSSAYLTLMGLASSRSPSSSTPGAIWAGSRSIFCSRLRNLSARSSASARATRSRLRGAKGNGREASCRWATISIRSPGACR